MTDLRIRQVGTVIVPVNDQDQALAFSVDKLGFEKRTDAAYGDGQRWLEVAPPGGATSIALVPPMEGMTAGIETRIGFESDDVDADPRDHVQPMFWFRDPDGNRYLLVQRGT